MKVASSKEMLRDAVLEIDIFHHAGEQRRAVRLGGNLTQEARDDNEAGPSHEALDDPTFSAAGTTIVKTMWSSEVSKGVQCTRSKPKGARLLSKRSTRGPALSPDFRSELAAVCSGGRPRHSTLDGRSNLTARLLCRMANFFQNLKAGAQDLVGGVTGQQTGEMIELEWVCEAPALGLRLRKSETPQFLCAERDEVNAAIVEHHPGLARRGLGRHRAGRRARARGRARPPGRTTRRSPLSRARRAR